MSEKVKCHNCNGTGNAAFYMVGAEVECEDCHGTGFAPTGEGPLTDVKIWDKELPSFFRDNTFPEIELETYGLAVAKAQAALTAGQMIELCKDAEILSSPNFKKKHPDYTYPFLTIHNFIKYLESRYGGG